MQIKLKSKSVNANISPEFAVGLGWIASEWQIWDLGEFVVTSLKDSNHSVRSKHKQNRPASEPGLAADIRTSHLFKNNVHKGVLILFARYLQKAGFGVVVHPDWLEGDPHLHVHLKKPIFTAGGR